MTDTPSPREGSAPQGGRIGYVSLASTVSALAVVTLHANGIFWHFDKLDPGVWASANIIESLFYFAVPVFFMISGTTLLDYRDRYDTATFFRKRIAKTVIPFVIWSLIGTAYVYLLKDGRSRFASLPELADALINTSVISIYWFFPILFLYYLTVPVFSAIPPQLKMNVVAYAAITGVILNSAIPLLINALGLPLHWHYTFGLTTNMVSLALLGYVISRYGFSPRQRMALYLAGLGGLVAHAWGTYHLTMSSGSIAETFKGYENLPSVLYACAVFVFIKEAYAFVPVAALRVIAALARYSFPVYLMHWFVIDAVVRLFDPDQASLLFRLGLPPLIYLAIIPIAWAIRRIPFLGRVLLP